LRRLVWNVRRAYFARRLHCTSMFYVPPFFLAHASNGHHRVIFRRAFLVASFVFSVVDHGLRAESLLNDHLNRIVADMRIGESNSNPCGGSIFVTEIVLSFCDPAWVPVFG